jgi:hypothetical protein
VAGIFTERTRDESDSPDYKEPHYDYLDRSARPEAENVRRLLEDWFTRWPEESKADLLPRLQSSDDQEFNSAFFELYLHELLVRSDYAVRVHPELGDTKRRPDFLVESKIDGHSFYLEATSANDSHERKGALTRLNVVLDSINGLDSPNFLLAVETSDLPASSPPLGRIRRDLEVWLSGIDVERARVRAEASKFEDLEVLTRNYGGWEVRFQAIPRRRTAGARGRRSIGILSTGARFLTTTASLRSSIEKKTSRYGELSVPYIVAVNAADSNLEDLDIEDALFGDYQTIARLTDDGYVQSEGRDTNGVWFGPKGPKNTRVSGVLAVGGLGPWSVEQRDPVLYLNPWARIAFPAHGLPVLGKLIPSDGTLSKVEGNPTREIFGLHSGWPESQGK